MTHHHRGRIFPAAWQDQRGASVRPTTDNELTEGDLELLRPLARRGQIADMAEQLGLPPITTKENER